VLHIGDRILVMREGRLMAEFSHAEVSEEKIMAAATGQLTAAGATSAATGATSTATGATNTATGATNTATGATNTGQAQ